jgi:hypothetical protein
MVENRFAVDILNEDMKQLYESVDIGVKLESGD